MTIYLHECPQCGQMELNRRMTDAAPKTCPLCHELGLQQIFRASFIAPCDSAQENLNGGLGEFYPQLGPRYLDQKTKKIPNPKAHARSRTDAVELFKAKGCEVEKC